jgi:hypothetical protein
LNGNIKERTVSGRHKNAMGLCYQDLITPIIKAIQELSAKVEALENQQ